MQADYVDLDEVAALPGNPKDHNVGEIHGSMERFGFIDRLIINTVTGHLVGGHGRIDTLRQKRQMGMEPPEGVEVRDGRWMVPVDYVKLPESEEMAAALALNRLEEMGGWNEPALLDQLTDLVAQGEEMLRGIGFDPDDVEELRKNLLGEPAKASAKDAETAYGAEDELLEKWGVQVGDVWFVGDGEAVLTCGDCRDNPTWERLLSAAQVVQINGLVTSPPYALQRKDQYGGVEESRYVAWWEAVQANARRHLAPDASFLLNIKPHTRDGERSLYVLDLVEAMVRRWSWSFVDEFCWLRPGMPRLPKYSFKNAFEPVYHFAATPRQFKFHPEAVTAPSNAVPIKPTGTETGGSALPDLQGNQGWLFGDEEYAVGQAYPSNVLKAFVNDQVRGHEAAFPVELPEFFIKAFSDPADAWIDPFMGSGSTLVAALRNGRQGLGIELAPRYVAVTLERLAEETGQTPRRLS